MPTDQPGALITARNWGWRHAGRKNPAVSGVDFIVEPGEKVLLLGPSGAGKSTLLQGLAGVLGGADEGEEFGALRVNGADPRTVRGQIGLVLQDPDSQVILSRLGDDVAFGGENRGLPRDEIWSRVDEALELVGLHYPRSHSTSALSGGEKQRLALAGVLALKPQLLLLDEPTANIDPAGIQHLTSAVKEVANQTGSTLVVVEHHVEHWVDLVDRVIVLDPSGGVLADGSATEILSSQGAYLAERGVWVPGFHPVQRGLGPQQTAGAPRRTPHATKAPTLSAHNLSIGRPRNPPVAQNVNVSFPQASCIGIMGPNGAGKSTLALTLAGLLAPLAGEVKAGDTLRNGIGPTPLKWRSKELITRIGTVFQDPEHQLVSATVRDELALGPRLLKLSETEVDQLVDHHLELLGLEKLQRANPFTLSGGEKRRLSVATALVTTPQTLILDEPTFGQDALTWKALVNVMENLISEGKTIIAVTHDNEFVTALADSVVTLEKTPATHSQDVSR